MTYKDRKNSYLLIFIYSNNYYKIIAFKLLNNIVENTRRDSC